MKKYKILEQQIFEINEYKLVPIRYQDRMSIMKWRNEQIYHLRQKTLLTKDDQEKYFINVIERLWEDPQPDQILFSLLKENDCIGYGGLVHINWIDKNSELSFIMNTKNISFSFSFSE